MLVAGLECEISKPTDRVKGNEHTHNKQQSGLSAERKAGREGNQHCTETTRQDPARASYKTETGQFLNLDFATNLSLGEASKTSA